MDKQQTKYVIQEAEKQFEEHDKHNYGVINKHGVIDALEHMFANNLTEADIREVKSHISYNVDADEFAKIVLMIKRKQKQEPVEIDENYIIDHFSLKEIELFRYTWERYCGEALGLNFNETRKVIEKVLKNYKSNDYTQLFKKQRNN